MSEKASTGPARSAVRNQHHVPRCLMGPFATPGAGKKPQVRVFDKQGDRFFTAPTENVFAQRDFNTFIGEDGAVLCLEDGMAEIESQAAPVLKKVLTDRALTNLNDEERQVLCVFVALQKMRGVALRAQMDDMADVLRKRIKLMGSDPDMIPQLKQVDKEAVKLTALELVRENLVDFSMMFVEKTMLLHSAPEGEVFYLGDTPVVWDNQTDTGPYGNLGLSVIGIEIYLPIAPNMVLAFWCPTILQSFKDKLQGLVSDEQRLAALALMGRGELSRMAAQQRPRVLALQERLAADVARIEQGQPIQLQPTHLMRLNALQVAQSERYVLSCRAEFSLAKEMITKDPGLRGGHRAKID